MGSNSATPTLQNKSNEAVIDTSSPEPSDDTQKEESTTGVRKKKVLIF